MSSQTNSFKLRAIATYLAIYIFENLLVRIWSARNGQKMLIGAFGIQSISAFKYCSSEFCSIWNIMRIRHKYIQYYIAKCSTSSRMYSTYSTCYIYIFMFCLVGICLQYSVRVGRTALEYNVHFVCLVAFLLSLFSPGYKFVPVLCSSNSEIVAFVAVRENLAKSSKCKWMPFDWFFFDWMRFNARDAFRALSLVSMLNGLLRLGLLTKRMR